MTDYELNPEIGELYPVLLDAKGNLIDGFHRRKANKNWHTIKLAQIKTKADLLTARIIANCQRMDHSEESKKWVNELATELSKEHSELAMSTRIQKITGMGQHWVLDRLDGRFKDLKKATKKPTGKVQPVGSTNDVGQASETTMPREPHDIRVSRDDELPAQRKQVLRQLNTIQVRITAWIKAVSDEEV